MCSKLFTAYWLHRAPTRNPLSLTEIGLKYLHVKSAGVPEAASLWGWRRKRAGRRWIACGACIGWVAGSDLYLDSLASYEVARQVAGTDRLTASEQTLRHRLRAHGLLASVDVARQTLLVRRTLAGCPRHVLHLKAGNLVGTITKTVTVWE